MSSEEKSGTRTQEALADRNPMLRFEQLLSDNWFLIENIEIRPELRERLQHIRTAAGDPFTILSAAKLSEELDHLLEAEFKETADPREVLVVFPGESAKRVRERTNVLFASKPSADALGYSNASVDARRVLYEIPQETLVPVDVKANLSRDPMAPEPHAIVGEILPNESVLPQYTFILVMDDVISSGETMLKLKERNAQKFPNAKWIAASWIMARPQNKAPAGIKGFDRTFAGAVLQRPSGLRPKINSLSTLVLNEERGQAYASDNVKKEDREEFLAILKALRADLS